MAADGASFWDLLLDGICRPPRDSQYGPEDLVGGANGLFQFGQTQGCRKDLTLLNKRGERLACSHFMPVIGDAVTGSKALPCVIYCHCNSGSRRDAEEAVLLLVPLGISVFAMDFAGSGVSDGEWVTLGANEADDIECVITHLRATGLTGRIALWGRAMGAVASILYCRRDPSIAALVLDSPFCRLTDLIWEVALQLKLPIPRYFLKKALSAMRRSVLNRAGYDVRTVSPIDDAPHLGMPALFGHGTDDAYITTQHSRDLHAAYKAEANIIFFSGSHMTVRPEFFYMTVATFLHHRLGALPQQDEPLSKEVTSIETHARTLVRRLIDGDRLDRTPQDSPTPPETPAIAASRTSSSIPPFYPPELHNIPEHHPHGPSPNSAAWLQQSHSHSVTKQHPNTAAALTDNKQAANTAASRPQAPPELRPIPRIRSAPSLSPATLCDPHTAATVADTGNKADQHPPAEDELAAPQAGQWTQATAEPSLDDPVPQRQAAVEGPPEATPQQHAVLRSQRPAAGVSAWSHRVARPFHLLRRGSLDTARPSPRPPAQTHTTTTASAAAGCFILGHRSPSAPPQRHASTSTRRTTPTPKPDPTPPPIPQSTSTNNPIFIFSPSNLPPPPQTPSTPTSSESILSHYSNTSTTTSASRIPTPPVFQPQQPPTQTSNPQFPTNHPTPLSSPQPIDAALPSNPSTNPNPCLTPANLNPNPNKPPSTSTFPPPPQPLNNVTLTHPPPSDLIPPARSSRRAPRRYSLDQPRHKFSLLDCSRPSFDDVDAPTHHRRRRSPVPATTTDPLPDTSFSLPHRQPSRLSKLFSRTLPTTTPTDSADHPTQQAEPASQAFYATPTPSTDILANHLRGIRKQKSVTQPSGTRAGGQQVPTGLQDEQDLAAALDQVMAAEPAQVQHGQHEKVEVQAGGSTDSAKGRQRGRPTPKHGCNIQ